MRQYRTYFKVPVGTFLLLGLGLVINSFQAKSEFSCFTLAKVKRFHFTHQCRELLQQTIIPEIPCCLIFPSLTID